MLTIHESTLNILSVSCKVHKGAGHPLTAMVTTLFSIPMTYGIAIEECTVRQKQPGGVKKLSRFKTFSLLSLFTWKR
jgi:hypothetical protein